MTRFSERFEAEPVAGASTATLGEERKGLDWPAVRARGPGLPLAGRHARDAGPGARGPGPALGLRAEPGRDSARRAPPGRLHRHALVVPVEQRQEGRWTRGDVARVRLEIEARSDHTWVVVDDPIPAGASILGGGLGRDSALLTATERRSGAAWPVFEERRFDAYGRTTSTCRPGGGRWNTASGWAPRGTSRCRRPASRRCTTPRSSPSCRTRRSSSRRRRDSRPRHRAVLLLGVALALAWLGVGGERPPAFAVVRDSWRPSRRTCSTGTAR